MNEHSSSSMDTASPFADDNAVAVGEFISRARPLSPIQWQTPRAVGKWTPCQDAQHLILSFRFFTEAILGRRELALEVSPERSRALCATVIPKLRLREPLPVGARSPAEADPTEVAHSSVEDRDSVLRDLVSAGCAFQAALLATTADSRRQVQHPYFGLIRIEEFEIVATAHTRHHMRFLPTVQAPAG